MKFKVVSEYKPSGDQPKAIDQITKSLVDGNKHQTLLGVTGSGKTFTIAHVIEKIQRPVLIISHNKTLAAQLYREFKQFFPNNAVEYFVSYYDYYQPEAYVPATDTYIEKETSINDEIDRLRLAATAAVLDRRDVLIVASVSCIYGLGNPEDYQGLILLLSVGKEMRRKDILRHLVQIQYSRNDADFPRGSFRVRGDVLEIYPPYGKNIVRVEMFGNEIERITVLEGISFRKIEEVERIVIYPAKHFVTTEDRQIKALSSIEEELIERVAQLKAEGKEFEAHRLNSKTRYDMEMIREVGYCNGIENYSRHLSNREPGSRPSTLLDYFPKDFITFIDESHVTVPQIGAMYNGDRARKSVLVDFGFRLPSALDNRPLEFDEFNKMMKQIVYVSATPSVYEIDKSSLVVEQIIRPTGLVDPRIEVRPTEGQIEDLLSEIRMRTDKKERVLVTTLTKKMSEDLSEYLREHSVKVRYLHSEIETIERVEILKALRIGDFDCLVGINLLREGLDLPEVSLVAILDADKIGFLRSTKSLIQTAGRAARHLHGQVIMYADRMSDAMKETIEETNRRRKIQLEYNEKHNITPKSIKKSITDILERKNLEIDEEISAKQFDIKSVTKKYNLKIQEDRHDLIRELEEKMFEFAEMLEFEKAAQIRDEIGKLKNIK